jgi:protein-S-isoprenylcysteine O-methyltransferase Ste14
MGFAADADGGALDWRGQFRLRYRLVDVDVPRLGRNLTDTVVTRRDAHFVDHGPYRFVRNPMYIGILMVGMSLGLALGTLLLPVAAGLMFTLLALRTRTEERYLIERFGDQYRDYMKRVGRFLPKLPA